MTVYNFVLSLTYNGQLIRTCNSFSTMSVQLKHIRISSGIDSYDWFRLLDAALNLNFAIALRLGLDRKLNLTYASVSYVVLKFR